MHRDALYIDKQLYSADGAGLHPVPRSGEYAGLVRRLFRGHSALAVVGVDRTSRTAEAIRGIAAELGTSGNRVLVVAGQRLGRSDMPSITTGISKDAIPNVWLWPDSDAALHPAIEEPAEESDWLSCLCREFDAVLLECPAIDLSPETAEIAAMADAAVLVVEAARTPKRQIAHVQRLLELRGVKLAGCILMKRR